jgi:hypothetical protein
MRSALGFRAHSGWAAAVAVAGTMEAPQVLERRRICIADPQIPGSKQPYHAAAGLPLVQAEEMVRTTSDSSRSLALAEISAMLETLRTQGHEVGRCGLLLAGGRALPAFDKLIASHALIHTAEGEMFRDVLVWAARQCHLTVTAVREKDLNAISLKRMNSIGKLIGPPWARDQKHAAVAALVALATA